MVLIFPKFLAGGD